MPHKVIAALVSLLLAACSTQNAEMADATATPSAPATAAAAGTASPDATATATPEPTATP